MKADLDPLQFFIDNGGTLLERAHSDTSRPQATLDIESAIAEENLRALQAISREQPHSKLIEVDPISDLGGHVCVTCALAFSSAEGLAMHVKHRHETIHLEAGVEFNRGLHSLSGVSVCRLCRRHLHDWSSLAKHVATGSCPSLKEALARGITHEALILEVQEREQVDPPSMPLPMPGLQDLGEYASWMDAPIAVVLQDNDLHGRLRSGCAICKQRLVGINRIKTHCQNSHKSAWDKVNGIIRGGLRSLQAIFQSPCQFCGSKARDTSAHSVQCPVMYQVVAIRELHRLNAMRSAKSPSLLSYDKTRPGPSTSPLILQVRRWAGHLDGQKAPSTSLRRRRSSTALFLVRGRAPLLR